ncbi:hypothetical protein [Salmonirosea aquatica]|uniref:Uncharacterized protein n=1 Tax=Salmonirosea aquatica TaxID=2654236 RepID=A0A7C9FSA6_9BACT|nr:hypothetical protein [Cytophagaceae bacterium SJW1-29]
MKMKTINRSLAHEIKSTLFKKAPFRQLAIYTQRCSLLLKLSFAFLLVAVQVQGQGQGSIDALHKRNQFRIGVGADYIKTVDLLYSTNMFKSIRTEVQLEYSHQSKKGIFWSDLHVFSGALIPNSGSDVEIYAKETDINGVESTEHKVLEISQIGFNLRLGYLHKMQQVRSSSNALYIGGSLEENLTYIPGFINIGLINNGSFNAKARFDYFLRNGKPIFLELGVPLASVVTRMPYHQSPGRPDESVLKSFFTGNNKLETLNHFQNVRFSIKYPLLVKKRIALDIMYAASWMHYYKPNHLTEAGSQLSLGFTF